MQRRVQYGYSILLPVAAAVQIFGVRFKLSCITEVPHAHFKSRLILNLSEKHDEGMPIVNYTIEREISPETIKFG